MQRVSGGRHVGPSQGFQGGYHSDSGSRGSCRCGQPRLRSGSCGSGPRTRGLAHTLVNAVEALWDQTFQVFWCGVGQCPTRDGPDIRENLEPCLRQGLVHSERCALAVEDGVHDPLRV